MWHQRKEPKIELIVNSVKRMLKAVGEDSIKENDISNFLNEILFGERNLWKHLTNGIITPTEIRNVVLDRLLRWIETRLSLDSIPNTLELDMLGTEIEMAFFFYNSK